jgi:hypothetical protein
VKTHLGHLVRFCACLVPLTLLLAVVLPMRVSAEEMVGAYPAIGIEAKQDWSRSFHEEFQDALSQRTWSVGGVAEIDGPTLRLSPHSAIVTNRTFSAEDIRLAVAFDDASVLPRVRLIDADSAKVLLSVEKRSDGVWLICGGQELHAGDPAGARTLELLLENDTATVSLLDGNQDILYQTQAVPFTYGVWKLALAAGDASASLQSVDVYMRTLVYAGDLLKGMDDGMLDGTWSLPLYQPPLPYEGDPVNLYHAANSTSGSSRYEQVGFFMRRGVGGKPDVLSVLSDGTDTAQYTGINSLTLNRGIPLGDHNIVITFDAFRSEVQGGMVCIGLNAADHSGGLGQLNLIGDSDVRLYRHLGAHNIATRWVDANGAPLTFTGLWVRYQIEISPEHATLRILTANGANAGKTICEVTDTFYGTDLVLSIITMNAKSMVNIRNFSILGVPAERQGETLLPEYPSGTETEADSSLVQPVTDFLSDTDADALEWLNPANKGTYVADQTVPDTLDLAERGAMAVQGLTNFLDGATLDGSAEDGISHQDYAPYGQTIYSISTPFMTSYPSSGQQTGSGRPNWGKITEATVMARIMSGSQYGLEAQRISLVNALKYTTGDADYLQLMDVYDQMAGYAYAVGPLSRIMMTLQDLYEINPNADLRQRAALKALIDEMAQANMHNAVYQWAIDEETGDKYCLYGANLTSAPSYTFNSAGNLGYIDINLNDGNSLRALSRWGALGESAKEAVIEEVTGLFSNLFTLSGTETGYGIYTPDEAPKAMAAENDAAFDGHIHAAMLGLLGLFEYGAYTRDVETLEFVRDGYEYVRGFGMSSIGLFGETCTVGEMTALAVLLSRAGVGDYWDDVDRYVRNQLAEVQLTDDNIAYFADYLEGLGTAESLSAYNRLCYAEGTTQQVLDRVYGTFLTDSTHPTHITSLIGVICCTGNAMQGLYYAWEGIVTENNGAVSVNLPLNRSSAWVDVDSYIPYEGKLVLHVKEADTVCVHIPDYVDLSQVLVNEGTDGFSFFGRYLLLDHVRPGDEIEITFPIETWTETHYCMWRNEDLWHKEGTNPGKSEEWSNQDPALYQILFKANTVISIQPLNQAAQASGYALYQDREGILTVETTPMKTITRYIPDSTLRPSIHTVVAESDVAEPAPTSQSVTPDEAAEAAYKALWKLFSGGDTQWASVLSDAAALYDAENTEMLEAKLREAAEAVMADAVWQDDMACVADLPFDDAQTPNGIYGYGETIRLNAEALLTMLRFAAEGDQRALTLAGGLSRYLRQEKFWRPETSAPAVSSVERGMFTGHMPSYAKCLYALAKYADLADDAELRLFVRAGYEYIRCYGLSGAGLYGDTGTAGWMACIAVELTNSGAGDYTEDVDRILRNGLLARLSPSGLFNSNSNDPWAYLTDPSLSASATEAALEALCAIRDFSLTQQGGTVLVRMLLDMETPQLRIHTGFPNQGSAAIENQDAETIVVRIPLYANHALVQASVNGAPVDLSWNGQMLLFQGLKAGDLVEIHYDVPVRTEEALLKWQENAPVMSCTDPGTDWLPASRILTMTFAGNQMTDSRQK